MRAGQKNRKQQPARKQKRPHVPKARRLALRNRGPIGHGSHHAPITSDPDIVTHPRSGVRDLRGRRPQCVRHTVRCRCGPSATRHFCLVPWLQSDSNQDHLSIALYFRPREPTWPSSPPKKNTPRRNSLFTYLKTLPNLPQYRSTPPACALWSNHLLLLVIPLDPSFQEPGAKALRCVTLFPHRCALSWNRN